MRFLFLFQAKTSAESRSARSARAAFFLILALFTPGVARGGPPAPAGERDGEVPRRYPLSIDGGSWDTGHVQGVAVNREKGHLYFSFTRLLVKTDLEGNVLGTMGGFTGHLGDLEVNPVDGRVYGSLEYKAQTSFYIAMIEGDRINQIGISAQDSTIFKTVALAEVASDYAADLDGDGVFDGDTGKTADHRFGCSGIDGVSFGPAFGQTGGKSYLTVAYGIYSNTTRRDNDHQVLLQYDTETWAEQYARPLIEAAPHASGPEKPAGKYFVYTGNTRYGVQNLAYDESGQRWLLGVYRGEKPSFPNYGLFSVEASAAPVMKDLRGTGERGLLLPLAPAGTFDKVSGSRGWMGEVNTGLVPLGEGLFYLAKAGRKGSQHSAELILHRWVGGPTEAFKKVTR